MRLCSGTIGAVLCETLRLREEEFHDVRPVAPRKAGEPGGLEAGSLLLAEHSASGLVPGDDRIAVVNGADGALARFKAADAPGGRLGVPSGIRIRLRFAICVSY